MTQPSAKNIPWTYVTRAGAQKKYKTQTQQKKLGAKTFSATQQKREEKWATTTHPQQTAYFAHTNFTFIHVP